MAAGVGGAYMAQLWGGADSDGLGAVQATCDPFEGLTASLLEDWLVWKQWIDCKDPMKTPVPCGFEERVNAFQRIMVLKAFREEKCLEAMRNYVRAEMGAKHVQ